MGVFSTLRGRCMCVYRASTRCRSSGHIEGEVLNVQRTPPRDFIM